MSWKHIARGKSQWIPSPIDDGTGEWVYTCPVCQDTGWVIDTKQNTVYKELATSLKCECATRSAPIQDRPDISSAWPWVKHDNRLRFRVAGDKTHWIYQDGKLVVYDWPADQFHYFEPDLALKSLYHEVYNRRSTRRSHPGSEDYYAK